MYEGTVCWKNLASLNSVWDKIPPICSRLGLLALLDISGSRQSLPGCFLRLRETAMSIQISEQMGFAIKQASIRCAKCMGKKKSPLF